MLHPLAPSCPAGQPLPPGFETVSGEIRCTGNPAASLSEAPVQILLLLRAASVLNLPLSPEISAAIRQLYPLLPGPGITGETAVLRSCFSALLELLCGDGAGRVLRDYTDVFALLLPPLGPTVGYDQQNPHHLYTVWEHTVRAVENISPDPLLRLVMLLHDTGKPRARTTDEKGVGHYKGHQQISAALTREVLTAWACDPAFIDRAALLVEAHDIPLSTDPVMMKRRLARFGEENLRLLFLIHRADRIATGTRNPAHADAHCLELSEALDRLLEKKS